MKKKLTLGLLVLGGLLWIARDIFYGVSFILGFSAAACWGIAFLIWLTMPFESPRLRHICRVMLVAIAILAAVGAVSFIWIESLIFSGREGNTDGEAGILVVLGAGLNGSTPSAVLRARLDVTYDYMVSRPEAIAILTGGQGDNEDVTEASAMAAYLIDKGIARDRLILEEEARNTAQNIKFSVALMQELGLEGKVMVVSSEFHLYRAERIFARYDMEVLSLPAPTPQIGLVPLNSYVREYCSIVIMGIKDVFGIDE